jgi:hypothetical protein
MKTKTSDLTGTALDWAVARANGYSAEQAADIMDCDSAALNYSGDWSKGGPIIEREKIRLDPRESEWQAQNFYDFSESRGPTPLVAAMRCYVALKLGDEIEIPEELA